jgi:diacylglycerol kinase family enzyme
MNKVLVIHNPSAGDEKHGKEQLLTALNEHGYTTEYRSTDDDGWKEFDDQPDILLIAGGDGTVRTVVKQLLKKDFPEKALKLALIPMGTANNISKALNIEGNEKQIIGSLDEVKPFDVGKVNNIPGSDFFLESFGYGVFPYLMMEMDKQTDVEDDDPKEKLSRALKLLLEIIDKYEAKECSLHVDGMDHSGKFILAEVMNTPSIGPNLKLSPYSDPGDGMFELVLVPGKDKERFRRYVQSRCEGNDDHYSFPIIKGRDISICWEGTHVHIDDQTVKLKAGDKVDIKLHHALIEFMV